MTTSSPSTNKNVSVLSYTDPVDGSCCSTVPVLTAYVKLPSDSLQMWQDGFQCYFGSLGLAFALLLITARCGVCFRRVLFLELSTISSSPVDLIFEYSPLKCWHVHSSEILTNPLLILTYTVVQLFFSDVSFGCKKRQQICNWFVFFSTGFATRSKAVEKHGRSAGRRKESVWEKTKSDQGTY